MEKDTKKFFQITEAAHACGVSRSTLMRLEEKGLLAPAYIAPESGRRYYDNHNVSRIMQIEKLKAMGLSAEEIAGYFACGGEVSKPLAVLEKRLHDLQRSVEELRLRSAEELSISVQIMRLPAVTCLMRQCTGRTVADKYADMYDFTASASAGAVCSPTSRFSRSRRGKTIWKGTSVTSPIPISSAFPCGQRVRPRTRWCCRNAGCCQCCTAAIIPAWTRRGWRWGMRQKPVV